MSPVAPLDMDSLPPTYDDARGAAHGLQGAEPAAHGGGAIRVRPAAGCAGCSCGLWSRLWACGRAGARRRLADEDDD